MPRCTIPAFLAIGCLVISLTGCSAKDSEAVTAGRPVYSEPDPGGAGRATLRGIAGLYVQGVDGARVVSGSSRVNNVGGNVVIVSAGMRSVRVIRDSAMSLNTKSKVWEFDFMCEKGHTYEFTLVSPVDPRLKVTDKTIGESLIVPNDELVAAW